MGAARLSDITIRRAVPADAALLARLGATTFIETFAALNHPDDFAVYMHAAFGEEIQRAELEDPAHHVFFAERDGDDVGYVMLRELATPACVRELVDGVDALQIARLYATASAIGTGVGAALLRHAFREAASRGKGAVWLGVWQHNVRALEFYRRFELVEAGTQPFLLGDDLQTDLVLARRIPEEH